MPQNPSIQYAAIAVFFGIMIFLLILSLIAYVFLFYYFNHPIIRRNTPMISSLVLSGIVFILIDGIIICTGISDASCIIFIFFYNIGFSLILGGIIAKNYRIYKIFNNRRASAVDISDLSLFLIVFVIVFYFTLLAIFFAIAGFKAEIFQSSSDPFYLYYDCAIKNKFWQIFLAIFNQVSLLLIRFLALGFAWINRKVVSTYSESRAVTALVLIYLCLDICFLPLYFALQNGTDSAIYKLVIKSIYICLISVFTLILLFYSRFYKVYQYEIKLKKKNSNNRD